MRLNNSRFFMTSLALALVATACSSDYLVVPVDAGGLPGRWYEQIGIPGASTVFDLTVTGATVMGSGSYTMEAGQPGTLTVTGEVSGNNIRLDITRSDSLVIHFNGTLITPYALSGYAYQTGPHQVGVSDPAPRIYRHPGQV